VASFGSREELGEEMDIGFTGLLTFPEIEKYSMRYEDIPSEIIREAYRRSKKHNIPIKFEVNNRRLSINKCMAWMEPYIMRDGYVMPCCGVMMSNKRDFLRKHALGNVNEKHFRDVWNSRKYKLLREFVNNPKKPVPSICANCRPFDTKERQKKYGVVDISKI
jgi:radical SAM protein with 4Fe4S-binding SPASM domain